jgi:hypothetical protein
MIPTLMVSSMGLFPPWIPILAFVGWLIWSYFAIFHNIGFFRLLPVATLVLGFGSSFWQLRPCWQWLHPFSVLDGRLCFGTSLVQLIYVGNHRSCVLVNYIWSNGRLGNFLDFGSPISYGFHLFLSLFKDKFCSPIPPFCPSIYYSDSLGSNDNALSYALDYDKNRISFQSKCCLVLSLVFCHHFLIGDHRFFVLK